MKKFLAVLILSIILFSQVGSVLAIGEICCSDGDCTAGEECLCEPSPDCAITDGRVTVGKSGICGRSGSIIICPPSRYTSIEALIESITNWIFYVGIVLAPLMILIGAFIFMTSAGDPNKVQTAKKIIIWTVIGFAIILFSKGLISLIKYILGG